MIAPAEGQPAPHTPSPGRTMAIGRRGSYAKTTPRTRPTSPRVGAPEQEFTFRFAYQDLDRLAHCHIGKPFATRHGDAGHPGTQHAADRMCSADEVYLTPGNAS
jgi:hypothetical protein